MSNIPKARAILQGILDGHELHQMVVDDIHEALDLMTRKVGPRHAPVKSAQVTPQMASEIRAYARRFPSLTQAEIGTHFNVNPGRVSEALRGER